LGYRKRVKKVVKGGMSASRARREARRADE